MGRRVIRRPTLFLNTMPIIGAQTAATDNYNAPPRHEVFPLWIIIGFVVAICAEKVPCFRKHFTNPA